MAAHGGDGGVGRAAPPAAGPSVVNDPAGAVEEEAGGAEDDPAAHGRALPLAAVPPRFRLMNFDHHIRRYINKKQYDHLELYVKTLIDKLRFEPTVEREHVALILNCRLMNLANIAKVQGYEYAWDYFNSHVSPLRVSNSPYANNENIQTRINTIETNLKEFKPLLYATEETLELSICDYLRFYSPTQVGYPASEKLRSRYYEFVFPVFGGGQFRCLLCQQTWIKRPSTFLEKHFNGKEVCPNQTNDSKARYFEFAHTKGKRKADSPLSTNLKLKAVRLEPVEEDKEIEKEKQNMPQLFQQGRSCIQELNGPFLNQDFQAFMRVQSDLYQILASMEDVWKSHSENVPLSVEDPPQDKVYASSEISDPRQGLHVDMADATVWPQLVLYKTRNTQVDII